MSNIYDFKDSRNVEDFYNDALNEDYINRVESYANNLQEDYIRGKEQYNIAASKQHQELFPVRPVEYPKKNNVMVGWPKLWKESWDEMIANKNSQNTGYNNKVLRDIITKNWGKEYLPKHESAKKTSQLLSEKRRLFAQKQILESALRNNNLLTEAIDCIADAVDTVGCCTINCCDCDESGFIYGVGIPGDSGMPFPIQITYDVLSNTLTILYVEDKGCGGEECIAGVYDLDGEECIDSFYQDLQQTLDEYENSVYGYTDDVVTESF